MPLPVGAFTPYVIRSLDPPDSALQTASQSVQPFFHSSRQRIPSLQLVLNAINAQFKKKLMAAINEIKSLTTLF